MYTLFRTGPMTKQDLAKSLDISLPTIFDILKELKDKELIKQGEVEKSSGGRRPVFVTPIFNAKVAVGVEISYNSVRFVLTDLGPNIIVKEKHQMVQTFTAEYFTELNQLLQEFIDKNVEDKNKLLGVAVALQYPIEKCKNLMFPASGDKSLSQVLEEISAAFDMPVAIYNAPKMAAIGQIWALGEFHDFVYLMLGSTIGGALFLNKAVYGGGAITDQDFKMCEPGHMTIVQHGELCSCGQRGCFECYCSTLALEQRSGVSLDEFFATLEKGSRAFAIIWEEYLQNLLTGINNLNVLFNSKVVIGGSMSPYLRKYANVIRERLALCSPFGDTGNSVIISDLGEFGPAIGAALTQVDKFLSFD